VKQQHQQANPGVFLNYLAHMTKVQAIFFYIEIILLLRMLLIEQNQKQDEQVQGAQDLQRV